MSTMGGRASLSKGEGNGGGKGGKKREKSQTNDGKVRETSG